MAIWWRVSATGRVFWKSRPVWGAVSGLVVAYLAGDAVASTTSEAVRIGGAILQILGLIILALGLERLSRLFEMPSIWKRIRGWFHELISAVLKPRGQVIGVGGLAATASSAAGVGAVIKGVAPGADLAERVAVLEENLNSLRSETQAKFQELRQEVFAKQKAFSKRLDEGLKQTSLLEARLRDSALGDFDSELIALFWMGAGVLASSFPETLASWLSFLG